MKGEPEKAMGLPGCNKLYIYPVYLSLADSSLEISQTLIPITFPLLFERCVATTKLSAKPIAWKNTLAFGLMSLWAKLIFGRDTWEVLFGAIRTPTSMMRPCHRQSACQDCLVWCPTGQQIRRQSGTPLMHAVRLPRKSQASGMPGKDRSIASFQLMRFTNQTGEVAKPSQPKFRGSMESLWGLLGCGRPGNLRRVKLF